MLTPLAPSALHSIVIGNSLLTLSTLTFNAIILETIIYRVKLLTRLQESYRS